MDNYGVVGNPVSHSKSPLVHKLFAEQTGQQLHYSTFFVEPDNLEKALAELQSQGIKGVNITLPFKRKAFALVDTLSERAQRAEAINTIMFNEDGTRFGDTTDGVGLVKDIIVNQEFLITKKRVLVLGAGGAVRGIIDSLLSEKPKEIIIANRTESKAVALAEEFGIQACELSLLENNSFDLVINGTSGSLQGEMLDLPGSILKKGALCYDMFYGQGQTPFLRWAAEQDAAYCIDGLGMLVEQAAESFFIWRNVKPNTAKVLAALKENSEVAEII